MKTATVVFENSASERRIDFGVIYSETLAKFEVLFLLWDFSRGFSPVHWRFKQVFGERFKISEA